MTDDATFSMVLIIGAALVVPIAIYYRVRSQSSGEKLDRREEGWFILLTLRPIGILSMLGLLAFMIDPAWMAWSSISLPTWLRWCGVAVGVLAGTLLIWTFQTLGKNLTDTVVTRREHSLITRGPYRWVRHPFYVAFALAVIANSLVTTNEFIFATGSLAFGLVLLRTPREEARLLARFGEEYQRYRERTGKFWPRRK